MRESMMHSNIVNSELTEKERYVAENIDKALEEGWIKVLYQPIVRSLSGQISGLEALARWKDPDHRTIQPEVLIPALVKSEQLLKLDSFMAHQVCKEYRERADRGQGSLPVSINLMESDFREGNIFEVVEDATQEFCVPRKMLRIEIKEDLLFTEDTELSYEVSRFHYAGYPVWLDGFGEGSPLLTLQGEKRFDRIKIDIRGLSDISGNASHILTAVIDVVKKMGLETQTIGVATKSQAEFLRNLGCEHLQGFYFGEPAGFEEVLATCREDSIIPENESAGKYYQEAGQTNFATDSSLALFGDDGRRFYVIYANPQFMSTVGKLGRKNEEDLLSVINDPRKTISKNIRRAISQAMAGGHEGNLIYEDTGGYGMITVKPMALQSGVLLHRVKVDDVTATQGSLLKTLKMSRNERLANQAMREALKEENPSMALEVLINGMGENLKPERAYMYELKGSSLVRSCDWRSEELDAETPEQQKLAKESCLEFWKNVLDDRDLVVVTDLEKSNILSPKMYELLKAQNVHSMIAVPLWLSGKRVGFFGLNNPPEAMFDTAPSVLESIGRFITMQIRLRDGR